MAMASSSSPTQPPPNASNLENSATQPTLTTPPQGNVKVDVASRNGLPTAIDKKPETAQHFEFLDGEDYIEKYSKYESDYTRRLMAKYFSEKNLYGGNTFEEKMTIDEEAILSSRWPGTRSFADPVLSFEEQSSGDSTSPSETLGR
ncbi:uncharacterized protein LOC119986668 isoform X2 [Tripterygium wilfordii]|uniref:uncharacterized protein LOC119986668 isoform X2 n=1 Tax=Tripterygium wilfordii TaxID=458696 RepID=UPI0018F85692|nr:uncharacterized protein LOC119986668 isoform X2 [Tripterygium wilfordii]